MSKLYVLVRRDLPSLVHCGVQGAHAVAEFFLAHPEVPHHTLVFLGVENKFELTFWLNRIKRTKDSKFVKFKEPYWNNEITAIAVLGDDKVKDLVKELNLL